MHIHELHQLSQLIVEIGDCFMVRRTRVACFNFIRGIPVDVHVEASRPRIKLRAATSRYLITVFINSPFTSSLLLNQAYAVIHAIAAPTNDPVMNISTSISRRFQPEVYSWAQNKTPRKQGSY